MRLRDNYRLQCNHSRGSVQFNFNTKKCALIIIIALIVGGYIGVNEVTNYFNKKKIADLQDQLRNARVVDNGDGTQSTSIAKGIEDKSIVIKEDMSNHGKQIMFSHKLEDSELERLSLTYREDLSWGGYVEVVNNADITFEYLFNPENCSVTRLKSGYHLEISKKDFEARALLEGKEIVKSKLSAGGHLEQALDFKKKDFLDEAMNNAERKIREDAQAAAEKTLNDAEVMEKLYSSAIKYYTKFLKKYGVKIYITIE